MLIKQKLHEITINGYSPRYVAAVRDVLHIEGGYVNDPHDYGGATKYGISLRFLVKAGQIDLDGDGFADFDLDMDGDVDGMDVRGLTKGDAIYLYHGHFWKPMDCDSFARPIGEMVFDQGVNGGFVAARKILQAAINALLPDDQRIAVDGQIGPATRAALDWVFGSNRFSGVSAIAVEYRKAAAARYRAIVARDPSQRRFINGWLRRAADLGRATERGMV